MNLANTTVLDEISIFPVSANATFMPDDTSAFESSANTYIDFSEDNPYNF